MALRTWWKGFYFDTQTRKWGRVAELTMIEDDPVYVLFSEGEACHFVVEPKDLLSKQEYYVRRTIQWCKIALGLLAFFVAIKLSL